jgi:hypothetical protein
MLLQHMASHTLSTSFEDSYMAISTQGHQHQMTISLHFMKKSVFMYPLSQHSTLPVISAVLAGCDVSASVLCTLGEKA